MHADVVDPHDVRVTNPGRDPSFPKNGERVTHAVLRAGDLFETGHVLMRVNPSLALPEGAPLDVDTEGGANDGHVTLDPVLAGDLERASQLTASGVSAVLAGESGTGKEVLARWLHAGTGRPGRFVAVNCGAIPSTLFESQLFGHVRGAFSGALRDEVGLVRAAERGTLFLDEIADLPRPSQAALLRVLQEREVVPLGATHPIKVDLRLISATHQPLEQLVERGEFRRDLFARIAGLVVTLPALRDRGDDLGVLIAAILAKVAPERASKITFSSEVGRRLAAHPWPLNIRELEQCIATCVTIARDGHVAAGHLPRSLVDRPGAVARSAHEPDPQSGRDEKVRMKLLEALSRHQGNVAATARELGKAPMQIHRWCRRFGIDPRPFRQ